MAILEKAAEYILGILTENEEVKKFPKEFIDESVKWVKSWFLRPEEPIAKAVLENKAVPEAAKKPIIEAQLVALQQNPDFMRELSEKLNTYIAEKHKTMNTIEDTELDVKGNFRQGNTGSDANSDADERNTIKRSKIIIGGDFRQGDDTTIS